MDFDKLPDDFFVTSHQFTKTAYRDQYSAIDPTSPALSQAGKVVVITGASKGIGRKGLAPAFAKANAKGIVLVARSAEQLAEVEREIGQINDKVKLLSVPTDIVDEASVDALFEKVKAEFGTADVLVNNAGLAAIGPLASIDTKKWWMDFEINVKGTFLVTRGFLRLIGTEKPATVVNINSGAAMSVAPGMSSYGTSKLAMTHLAQFIAAEHPNVVAIAASPGTVLSDMTFDFFRRFAKDTPELIGGLSVWLATDTAKFLNGRYVCANWSVDELVQRKDEIVGEGKLLTGLNTKLGIDQPN